MIKCKLAADAECGKVCCCLVCEDVATCDTVCPDAKNWETSTNPCEECSSAYEEDEYSGEMTEEMALVEFESAQIAAIQSIADLARQKKNLEEQEKTMKEQLKAAMEKYNIKKFESEELTLTYVAATTATSIDSAKLKKKYPDIAAECSKTSSKSAYVTVKV